MRQDHHPASSKDSLRKGERAKEPERSTIKPFTWGERKAAAHAARTHTDFPICLYGVYGDVTCECVRPWMPRCRSYNTEVHGQVAHQIAQKPERNVQQRVEEETTRAMTERSLEYPVHSRDVRAVLENARNTDVRLRERWWMCVIAGDD